MKKRLREDVFFTPQRDFYLLSRLLNNSVSQIWHCHEYYEVEIISAGTAIDEINGTPYVTINADSQNVIHTISITKAGDYVVRIVSDDGSVISSYKFIKSEPLNSTTKIVLICVGIGAVVLVVLFFFIRKKGKYR